MNSQPTLLIISQVYVPDPAAVGQYIADAADELARRDFRVVVLTSRRGYDDPLKKYPAREDRDGVEIKRLPFSSFGKRSIAFRLIGAAAFLSQAILRGLFVRNLAGVLVSTSPPMGSLAALVIAAIRRVPIIYWAMDINPDQAVALRVFRAGSLPVRLLETLNRAILRRAACIVALDKFMAERLRAKQECGDRLAVIPPWPLEETRAALPHADNPFRHEHGLQGKFVVMYSGNITPVHPLDTVLEAFSRLKDRAELVLMLIGNGQGRSKAEQFAAARGLTNIRFLPYQPLERLYYSLSAADVHLVSMGQNMVGLVHPCKIYGAMACGRPVLLLGPRTSHAGELIDRYRIGWSVNHGDVDAAVASLESMLAAGQAELAMLGRRALLAVQEDLSRSALRQAFCDCVETALAHARLFPVSARPAGELDAAPQPATATARVDRNAWPVPASPGEAS